jgi:hypothetical protein
MCAELADGSTEWVDLSMAKEAYLITGYSMTFRDDLPPVRPFRPTKAEHAPTIDGLFISSVTV